MDIPTPEGSHTDPTVPIYDRNAVVGQPGISLSKDQVLFTPTTEGSSASTNLVISNSGSGVLAFRVTSGASWLKLSRNQGVALGGELGGRALTLNITAHTAGLGAGFYSAIVRVESLYGGGSPATMTVNMSYAPGPVVLGEGALVKGSGPEVYVLTGGLRRHIPDAPTFLYRGYSWNAWHTLGDAALASYPLGRPLPSVTADGRLVRGTGPEIYVMTGGARRHIPSPEIFAACGYSWDGVAGLPPAAIGAVPDGGPITGACPKLVLPDGALIRGGGPEVFFMQAGIRRYIANGATFEAMGLNFANVDAYPAGLVNSIPGGVWALDALSDGMLLRSDGPEIYVMQGGQKRYITAPEILKACGYNWGAVRWITGATLSAVPDGPQLSVAPCPRFSPPNGTLLRGSGPEVWVLENGWRRHVVSQEIFAACGYHWGNLNVLSDGIVALLPETASLASVPCP
jgi:hypothetical protein